MSLWRAAACAHEQRPQAEGQTDSDRPQPDSGAPRPPKAGVAHRPGYQELGEKRNTPPNRELRLRTATGGRRVARDKFPASATSSVGVTSGSVSLTGRSAEKGRAKSQAER
ncbi:hypothetical protein I79_006532 [Cricetulus griseus]|uniref:Uncharacterized protein n=1 Tax=Cricetulus griseus TaxID=10029 RepID=G3H836_CRIGR|nr:hypothetical protein I79_006532 [Cricetulus griseus]